MNIDLFEETAETDRIKVTNIRYDQGVAYRDPDPLSMDTDITATITSGSVELWDEELEEWFYAGAITDTKHTDLRHDIEYQIEQILNNE